MWGKHKRAIVIGLVVMVVLGFPFVMMTEGVLDRIGEKAVEGREKPWAPDMIMRVGWAYYATGRYHKSSEWYGRFLEVWGESERVPEAWATLADSLEQEYMITRDQSRWTIKEECQQVLDDFLEEYPPEEFPDNEWVQQAEGQRRRLLYGV